MDVNFMLLWDHLHTIATRQASLTLFCVEFVVLLPLSSSVMWTYLWHKACVASALFSVVTSLIQEGSLVAESPFHAFLVGGESLDGLNQLRIGLQMNMSEQEGGTRGVNCFTPVPYVKNGEEPSVGVTGNSLLCMPSLAWIGHKKFYQYSTVSKMA